MYVVYIQKTSSNVMTKLVLNNLDYSDERMHAFCHYSIFFIIEPNPSNSAKLFGSTSIVTTLVSLIEVGF